jgi:transposase
MFLPNRVAGFPRTCKWASLAALIRHGGRTMSKAYSADIRMRVIARVEGGASRREAAEQLDISPSAAVKWVKCFHETGSCAATPRGGSTSPLEAHAPWLLTLIEEQSDLTVSAMHKHGIAGSRTAVWSFFERHTISFKKKPARRGAGSPGRGPGTSMLETTASHA